MSRGDRARIAALAMLTTAIVVVLLVLTVEMVRPWILFVVLLALLLAVVIGAYWFVFVPTGRRDGPAAGERRAHPGRKRRDV